MTRQFHAISRELHVTVSANAAMPDIPLSLFAERADQYGVSSSAPRRLPIFVDAGAGAKKREMKSASVLLARLVDDHAAPLRAQLC